MVEFDDLFESEGEFQKKAKVGISTLIYLNKAHQKWVHDLDPLSPCEGQMT